jgi:hypothetical protein
MGKANRRKRRVYLRWAIAVGLLIAAILGGLIYYVQKPGPKFYW